MTAAPHFEVVQSDTEQAWHVRIVGANGEIILTGEPLSGFDDAKNAVLAIARMFLDEPELVGRGDPLLWFVANHLEIVDTASVVYLDQRVGVEPPC